MVSIYTLPELNSSGVFNLEEPFNKKENEKVVFTVTAIRSLTECLDNQEKPYDTIYQPNGLTKEDYIRDLNNNIPIVTLYDGANEYNVPGNRIKSVGKLDGAIYQEKIVTIDLGVVPDDIDLEEVKTDIQQEVKTMYGVNTSVELIRGSEVMNKTTIEDYEFKRKRIGRMKNYVTYRTMCKDIKNRINDLTTKNKIVEDLLLNYRKIFNEKGVGADLSILKNDIDYKKEQIETAKKDIEKLNKRIEEMLENGDMEDPDNPPKWAALTGIGIKCIKKTINDLGVTHIFKYDKKKERNSFYTALKDEPAVQSKYLLDPYVDDSSWAGRGNWENNKATIDIIKIDKAHPFKLRNLRINKCVGNYCKGDGITENPYTIDNNYYNVTIEHDTKSLKLNIETVGTPLPTQITLIVFFGIRFRENYVPTALSLTTKIDITT